MRLFIAEKPSIAACIAQELGIAQRHKGWIECKNGDHVTNCFGHMMELAGPDLYLPDNVPLNKNQRKVWREQDLPILPKTWKKQIKSSCSGQMKIIKEQLSTAETVVNAGDPDREGQLLIDEVLEHFKYKGTVLRYWSSAMDRVSVQRALKSLVPNEKFIAWGVAAEARSRADWLIGMNMTRLASIRYPSNGVMSIGRVQTPVLKLIVDRDLSIENFKSQDFFNVIATFDCGNDTLYTGKWIIPEELQTNGYLLDKAKASNLTEKIQGKNAEITAYEQALKNKTPPLPFTLTDLQVACSKKFGFSAQKTLEIAQKLYEEYKLTSYPRSSCSYLPQSQQADVPKILDNIKLAFPELNSIIDLANPKRESKIWNDKKVGEEAHTGIVPTLNPVSAEDLNKIPDECQKVYELIAKRYLANFLPDFSYYQTTVETTIETKDKFKTVGRSVINQGWKQLIDDRDEEDKEEKLPALKKGKEAIVSKSTVVTAATKPPVAFNEGSIIAAMENISKFVENTEDKKLLKEGDGIGTAATRADIITKLKDRGFIETNKKKLVSTQLGRDFLKVVPPLLQSPGLTAVAERGLKQIQTATAELNSFILQQIETLKSSMEELKKMTSQHSSVLCPVCSQNIRRYESKFKKGVHYWHCLNPECGKNFADADGKIGVELIKNDKPKGICPKCKKAGIGRYESKKQPGTFFWWCRECKASFADDNGHIGKEHQSIKPAATVSCPQCRNKAGRYPTKADPKKFYWYCPSCKSAFADADGKIGRKFSK